MRNILQAMILYTIYFDSFYIDHLSIYIKWRVCLSGPKILVQYIFLLLFFIQMQIFANLLYFQMVCSSQHLGVHSFFSDKKLPHPSKYLNIFVLFNIVNVLQNFFIEMIIFLFYLILLKYCNYNFNFDLIN